MKENQRKERQKGNKKRLKRRTEETRRERTMLPEECKGKQGRDKNCWKGRGEMRRKESKNIYQIPPTRRLVRARMDLAPRKKNKRKLMIEVK